MAKSAFHVLWYSHLSYVVVIIIFAIPWCASDHCRIALIGILHIYPFQLGPILYGCHGTIVANHLGPVLCHPGPTPVTATILV